MPMVEERNVLGWATGASATRAMNDRAGEIANWTAGLKALLALPESCVGLRAFIGLHKHPGHAPASTTRSPGRSTAANVQHGDDDNAPWVGDSRRTDRLRETEA